MIVKVQISLFSSEAEAQVLIYNRDRSVIWQGPANKELIEAMDGEAKQYWKAHVNGKKQISLDKQVQERNW